jgi:uncharacterized OsmC-like protein
MTTTVMQTINGVDVPALLQQIEQAAKTPAKACFNFRIHNRWLGGGLNQSTVRDFSAGGQEIAHAAPFTLRADEPAVLLGGDRGANPVEHLLHALAGCITTSMVYHAAARGIAIQEVESALDGDIDLRGLFGVTQDVRNGYQAIRIKFRIKADGVPESQLNELAALGMRFSPVFDTLSHGVPIAVSVEPAQAR